MFAEPQRKEPLDGLEPLAVEHDRKRQETILPTLEKYPASSSNGGEDRRIFGLRVAPFWLLILLLVVVIGAVIDGGHRGWPLTITKHENVRRTASKSTHSPTPYPTHTSTCKVVTTTTCATSSAVTAGSTGIAAIDCKNGTVYTTADGVRYMEVCETDWPSGFEDIAGTGYVNDVQDVTTYTFELCMNACDNYNVKNVGQCNAVTYSANLTSSVAYSGGNCILKSAQANQNVKSGKLLASAVIIS